MKYPHQSNNVKLFETYFLLLTDTELSLPWQNSRTLVNVPRHILNNFLPILHLWDELYILSYSCFCLLNVIALNYFFCYHNWLFSSNTEAVLQTLVSIKVILIYLIYVTYKSKSNQWHHVQNDKWHLFF